MENGRINSCRLIPFTVVVKGSVISQAVYRDMHDELTRAFVTMVPEEGTRGGKDVNSNFASHVRRIEVK